MTRQVQEWGDLVNLRMTREEERIYEAQEHARKVYILKQLAFIAGRLPLAPEFVPCPVNPRKPRP